MADRENELLALLGNGSIRGSGQEDGRVGESCKQAQASPGLSPPFWTQSASVGMFVKLRAPSCRVSSIGCCILPNRVEESADRAQSNHAKLEGDGVANQSGMHQARARRIHCVREGT